MNRMWKIGTLFGIPIKLHISMVLVPIFIFMLLYRRASLGLMEFALGLAAVVVVFGAILLHELGHALVARRYGVKTYDIVLTPIGGMARLLDMPTQPKQEMAIAIAGPAVSLGLAAVSFVAALFVAGQSPQSTVMVMLANSLEFFWWINVILGPFNLLPAFPLDGGRILRSFLAIKRDFLTATRIAVRVGRVIAVIGAVYAIYGETNLLLAVIAVYIYYAAGVELRRAQLRDFRERARQQGADPTGPYGIPRSFTWPFNRPFQPPTRGGQSQHPYTPPHEDWTKPNPAQGQKRERDVVVIEGGKVEVISRKDPEEK